MAQDDTWLPSLCKHPGEEAFLQAIRDQPEDQALRLVYADWLEERDDSRGEFVRA
jgi:uncharacterized protein (TIGR02996 family)